MGEQIVRQSVKEFAEAMELVLRENDHKSGWDYISIKDLITRMRQELVELERSFNNCDPEGVIHEATDVANFAMMIHDNLTNRGRDESS